MALETEIAAFTAMKAKPEEHHSGKWVVFHGETFVDAFDSFETAAREAVRRFGAGPYLIRQAGGPPLTPSGIRHVLASSCQLLTAGFGIPMFMLMGNLAVISGSGNAGLRSAAVAVALAER